MTPTHLPTKLHSSAEAVLKSLAGPGARLRDDQWTAIEALVAHRRRALVVQRTGWGKAAVYLGAPELPALDGPVLLVDDRVDTGWTLTVAARALRHAGAPAVLPFALATISTGYP
jgi:ATP-dependent DNA helicase RecQ